MRGEESESDTEDGEPVDIQLGKIGHQERVRTKALVQFVLDDAEPSKIWVAVAAEDKIRVFRSVEVRKFSVGEPQYFRGFVRF